MYSCILKREVEERGVPLKLVATQLGLSYQQAYKVMRSYKVSYEDYNAISLKRVLKIKNKSNEVMEKVRQQVMKMKSDGIAEMAFNMPITLKE